VRSFRILVAACEDGYGPSALASYIVKALATRKDPVFEVTLWNATRLAYNRGLYQGLRRVRVEAVDNLIELVKPGGIISIRQTLDRIGPYRQRSDAYPGDARRCEFDLVLDVGVPAAARWAARWGVPSITVFDHAWSKTLAMIGEDLAAMGRPAGRADREPWEELIAEVRKDEERAEQLLMFPPFMTPDVFLRYWREELGVAPRRLGGTLGGQPECSREEARQRLGITEPGPTVLIQAGDTPVWAGSLERLTAEFVREDEALGANVVIYVPRSLPAADFDDTRLRRVRKLRPVPGGTIQRILPAVDFMLTRAGGGSVNDAVACRVPFACVEEPGQSQIEEILRAGCAAGLTRRIEKRDFDADPAGVALRQWEDPKLAEDNRESLMRMGRVRRGAEMIVVEQVLRRLGSLRG